MDFINISLDVWIGIELKMNVEVVFTVFLLEDCITIFYCHFYVRRVKCARRPLLTDRYLEHSTVHSLSLSCVMEQKWRHSYTHNTVLIHLLQWLTDDVRLRLCIGFDFEKLSIFIGFELEMHYQSSILLWCGLLFLILHVPYFSSACTPSTKPWHSMNKIFLSCL